MLQGLTITECLKLHPLIKDNTMPVKVDVIMPEDIDLRLQKIAASYLTTQEEIASIRAEMLQLQQKQVAINQKNSNLINEIKGLLGNGPASKAVIIGEQMIVFTIPFAGQTVQIMKVKQEDIIGKSRKGKD